MPGDKYRSIQNPRQYRALRRRGYSKAEAARISNARRAIERAGHPSENKLRQVVQLLK